LKNLNDVVQYLIDTFSKGKIAKEIAWEIGSKPPMISRWRHGEPISKEVLKNIFETYPIPKREQEIIKHINSESKLNWETNKKIKKKEKNIPKEFKSRWLHLFANEEDFDNYYKKLIVPVFNGNIKQITHDHKYTFDSIPVDKSKPWKWHTMWQYPVSFALLIEKPLSTELYRENDLVGIMRFDREDLSRASHLHKKFLVRFKINGIKHLRIVWLEASMDLTKEDQDKIINNCKNGDHIFKHTKNINLFYLRETKNSLPIQLAPKEVEIIGWLEGHLSINPK
jgi:hypothetical protein